MRVFKKVDCQEAGRLLLELVHSQAEWSQQTFGADTVRVPIGALEHLKLEADEAIHNPEDAIEYADCLLLILDAFRRSQAQTPLRSIFSLLSAAWDKHKANKIRNWPVPSDSTSPVFHENKGDQPCEN